MCTSLRSLSTSRKILAIALGLGLLFTGCSSGDAENDISANLEATQAESIENSDDENTADENTAPGAETDQDRYQALIASSTNFAQTGVGSGRLALGVSCLDGFPSPTAIITIQGQGLEPGDHPGSVTPSAGYSPDLTVSTTDIQDLPAGSAYRARQTGFEEAEYVFVWESLGATLTVPGC